MSDIKINVGSNAHASFGHVVQGAEVNISSGSGNQQVQQSGTALVEELLEAIRKTSGSDASRIAALESTVHELGHALAEPQNPGKVKKILELIKEHHSWAFPAIAAIVTKVAPMVAALIYSPCNLHQARGQASLFFRGAAVWPHSRAERRHPHRGPTHRTDSATATLANGLRGRREIWVEARL